jgi:hypothetical protein
MGKLTPFSVNIFLAEENISQLLHIGEERQLIFTLQTRSISSKSLSSRLIHSTLASFLLLNLFLSSFFGWQAIITSLLKISHSLFHTLSGRFAIFLS